MSNATRQLNRAMSVNTDIAEQIKYRCDVLLGLAIDNVEKDWPGKSLDYQVERAKQDLKNAAQKLEKM